MRTVADFFNKYRNASIEDIETRSAEIKALLNENGNIDISILNMEVEGMEQAKKNISEKETEQRAFNFTGEGTAPKRQEGDIFASSEYRTAFFKQMLGQPLNDIETRSFNTAVETMNMERRRDAFNTTTNTGAVLPTTTLNEVIAGARRQGGILQHVRQFNIPTNLSIPIGTPNSKAVWHEEGTLVESDKVNIENVEFVAHEILKVFSISASAKKMSIQSFESYLIQELTATVVECIADALVNGTGIKQGEGILTGVTWNGTNSFEFPKLKSLAYTDITKALGLLRRGYSAGAKFVMNNATLYNQVYGLVDGNQRPIFIQDAQGDTVGRILGHEIVIDDYLEDNVILLGDLNYLGFNLPEGIALEVSRESSFRSGLIDYRIMCLADTKVLIEDAFVKITKAIA